MMLLCGALLGAGMMLTPDSPALGLAMLAASLAIALVSCH